MRIFWLASEIMFVIGYLYYGIGTAVGFIEPDVVIQSVGCCVTALYWLQQFMKDWRKGKDGR